MRLGAFVLGVLAFAVAYTSGSTFQYQTPPDTVLYADNGRIRGMSDKEGKDIVLAAVIPIHDSRLVTCLDTVWRETLDYLEAFLYSIDLINSDENLLPNVTLGFDIRDSCLAENAAVEEAVDLVLLSNSERCNSGGMDFQNESMSAPPVSAVIGEYASFVTIPVANFLHLFDVPQISFSSTSPLLSNRERYRHFYRTVPSDTLQAQAMIDLALHFNWTYVSTIHSNDLYGEPGIDKFKELANIHGICIDLDIGLSDDLTDDQYRTVVDRIYNDSTPNVIIFFSSREQAEILFNKIEEVYHGPRKFLWIASDAWVEADNILSKTDIIGGMWGVIPQTTPDPGFYSYYSKLTPLLNKRNAWFIEFYEDYYNCKYNDTCQSNNWTITSNEEYKNYSFTPFVIDAVFAFAHAVNDYLLNNCDKPITWNDTIRNCEGQMTSLDGPTLVEYLKNVSFTSPTGIRVEFDETGSTNGIYKLENYQRVNDMPETYKFRTVGVWDGTQTTSSKLDIYENVSVQFGIHSNNTPANVMHSQCQQCSSGSVTVSIQSSCCGICSPCIGQNYTPSTELQQCMKCKEKMWGNNPLTGSDSCQDIGKRYLDPSDPWGIFLIITACLGIIGVIFVSVTMGIFWNTPIVKASGREQMTLLLVGIALCFLSTITFVIKPSIPACTLQRIGTWLCFSLILSALLVKLIRIARIFLRDQVSGRPKFIGPAYQILFTFLLVGFQMVLVFISLLVVHPEAEEIRQLNSENTNDLPSLIIRCKNPNIALIALHMLYFSALLIASNALSMVTIRFPANFREVVYVALSTFCIGIIWIAFIITYFATENEFRTAIVSFAIQMSAMAVLICMFGPRVFIMIFLPGRNVAQTTFTKNTDLKSSLTNSMMRKQNSEADAKRLSTIEEHAFEMVKTANGEKKQAVVGFVEEKQEADKAL